jgi:hypothetical protein
VRAQICERAYNKLLRRSQDIKHAAHKAIEATFDKDGRHDHYIISAMDGSKPRL